MRAMAILRSTARRRQHSRDSTAALYDTHRTTYLNMRSGWSSADALLSVSYRRLLYRGSWLAYGQVINSASGANSSGLRPRCW